MKPCEVCRGPLPVKATSRRRFCSVKCKNQAQTALRAEWNRQNRPKTRRANRKYARGNPQVAARMKAYYEAKPEVFAAIRHRRRLREGVDAAVVTERDWRRLVARYRGCCAYCGVTGPLTRDHVVPVSRGGRHAIGNLIPACRSCNSSKGPRLLVEWRVARL